MLVDALWRHTWPHDRLVVAASRLIRDLDSRAPGKRLRVHANRGLAGIDGTIATALGVADASQHGDELSSRAGMTRLLVGDLAFVHDASSLLVMQGGEDAPRLQIVVGNDGGGTIFDGLEVADTADATAFERVMRTGREVNIEAIADAFGWGYRRATTRSQLEEALTDQTSPRIVIEVPLDAEQGETDVDTE
ncbi:thiamine pyrophosphate-binding protein [Gulosibacter sediminis]|uniref:thiamine pyrophosphate-binding protein n=1 Tax=Gulosibacter sediminis TaxID=1729695 RepID=UPI001865E6FD|nr:thiamine pyrophosphate-binding protein [Gulosibacter sediminis]